MEIFEYLQLDITAEENCKPILAYVYEELEKLKSSDFSIDKIHIINGVIFKYVELAEHYGIQISKLLAQYGEELVEAVTRYQDEAVGERIAACMLPFEKIYTTITSSYGKIAQQKINNNSYLDLELLYNPDKSNKNEAIVLLKQVRSIIENDNELPNRLRKSILCKINNIVDSLQNEKCDWTQYFGKVHQLIIVLGAIGSISGGVASWVAVNEAKSKLIEATQIIESTSINKRFVVQYQENNSYNISGGIKTCKSISLNTLSLPSKTE